MQTLTYYYVQSNLGVPSVRLLTKGVLIESPYQTPIVFSSVLKGFERITFSPVALKFGENLAKHLAALLNLALVQAGEVSKSLVGPELRQGSLAGAITAVVNKASYADPVSLFAFVTELFCAVLMGHKLENGNKRLATALMFNALYLFGYYFDWAARPKVNWETQKTDIEKFVEKLANVNNAQTELWLNLVKTEIANWIETKISMRVEMAKPKKPSSKNAVSNQQFEASDLTTIFTKTAKDKNYLQMMQALAKR